MLALPARKHKGGENYRHYNLLVASRQPQSRTFSLGSFRAKNFTLASLKVENSDFLVQDYKKSNDSLEVNYCLQKDKMVIH